MNTRKKSSSRAAENEGKIVVSRTVVKSGETVEENEKTKRLQIRPFATDTASVSAKRGVTLNTGNYESLRIDVMVSVPCYVEEAVTVYHQVSGLVAKLLEKEIQGTELFDEEDED